jgi:hypothetical protein
MVRVFAVRMLKAANASGRNRALERLDRDRALVVAALVRAADGPIPLDGRSDALRRAVQIASEAGWITSTRTGYVAGPVEPGQHRRRRSAPAVSPDVPRFDPTRRFYSSRGIRGYRLGPMQAAEERQDAP